jgi:hypothetical protein
MKIQKITILCREICRICLGADGNRDLPFPKPASTGVYDHLYSSLEIALEWNRGPKDYAWRMRTDGKWAVAARKSAARHSIRSLEKHYRTGFCRSGVYRKRLE